MYGFIRVASCTPPMRLGDVEYNVAQIAKQLDEARAAGVRLAVFPELCVCGYTMGDLFSQSALLAACEAGVKSLLAHTHNLAAVVGLPVQYRGKLYNVAAVLNNGEIVAAVPKLHLPNYCEFYEARLFAGGENLTEIALCGKNIPCGGGLVFEDKNESLFTFGVEICEDMWVAESPSIALVKGGARIICNPSASVEVVGKAEFRRLLIKGHSSKLIAGYIYSDCGCGESTTDSVFAGHRIVAEDGTLLCESKLFTEGLTVTEIDVERIDFSRRQASTFTSRFDGVRVIPVETADTVKTLFRPVSPAPFLPPQADTERAEFILSLQAAGLRRRMQSCKSRKLVVGVSGGLDSALALLVAVRAAESPADVLAITMPCFGTGERTRKNAEDLCAALQVEFREIDINDSVRAHFKDIGHDEEIKNSVYENAQARERTQVLMDIANAQNALVVGTGDMSELALGWTTYNGDHMSSYGVNASVPKTLVRYLVTKEAERLGAKAGEALQAVAATQISPELLPPQDGKISQCTEEILGKYDYHDFFLYYAIRWGFAPAKVYFLAAAAFGEDKKTEIKQAMRVFYTRFFSQQFKRSCMPDGVKVGTVSLSPRSDWKMPSDATAALWLKQVEAL